MDRAAHPQQGTARRALSDKDLTRAQSSQVPEGGRHTLMVLLPAARRQRSRRSVQAGLGRTVPARSGRLVSRSAAKEGFDPRSTVSRWRPDFLKDFAMRMGWCHAE
jgi:hypothetical protein